MNVIDETDDYNECKWTGNNPAVAFDGSDSNDQGQFLSRWITHRSSKYKLQMSLGFKPYTRNDKRLRSITLGTGIFCILAGLRCFSYFTRCDCKVFVCELCDSSGFCIIF